MDKAAERFHVVDSLLGRALLSHSMAVSAGGAVVVDGRGTVYQPPSSAGPGKVYLVKRLRCERLDAEAGSLDRLEHLHSAGASTR